MAGSEGAEKSKEAPKELVRKSGKPLRESRPLPALPPHRTAPPSLQPPDPWPLPRPPKPKDK